MGKAVRINQVAGMTTPRGHINRTWLQNRLTLSMTCASSYSFLASSPTESSLKIFGKPRLGYRPRSCHVCTQHSMTR